MSRAAIPVTVTRYIEAPAMRVYDAWLIPQNASKWLFATPTGEMVRAEIEPRVGGRFVFTDRREGADVEHRGVFLELEPGRRIVFAFTVPGYSETPATVSVDIAAAGGGCKVSLTHEGVPAESADAARAGWLLMLELLAKETEQ